MYYIFSNRFFLYTEIRTYNYRSYSYGNHFFATIQELVLTSALHDED